MWMPRLSNLPKKLMTVLSTLKLDGQNGKQQQSNDLIAYLGC